MMENLLELCQLRRMYFLACEQTPPVVHAHAFFDDDSGGGVKCTGEGCDFKITMLAEGSGAMWLSHLKLVHPESWEIIKELDRNI